MLRVTVVVLLLLVGLSAADLGHSTSHFQLWYPQYGQHFADRLRDNCSVEYERSLTARRDPECSSCYIEPVISCLLENTKELEKSVMAAAGVVLGLLPTTMVFMGSNTVETGLVALRRPFLALILCAASPSISPLRPFDYRSPGDILKRRKDARTAPPLRGMASALVSTCEYALGLAAFTNIVHNTWEFSNRVVFAIGPETEYQPGLWLGLAVVAHFIGTGTLMLRVRIKSQSRWSRAGLWQRFRNEWVPCASQDGGVLQNRCETESYAFLFWSWFTSVGTVMFIIFGSCMFASALFISLRDAIVVSVRYLSSVVVARMVLTYELSGLRTVVVVPEDDEPIREQSQPGESGYELVQAGPNKTSPV